jgi:transcriptional regulator EpsA
MSAPDKTIDPNAIDPNDVALMSANDQERLMRAIEFALPICTRGQLFAWTQAYLQSLIAHELLLCACGNARRHDFTLLKISALPFSDEQLAEITEPRSGLMARAIDAWYKGGEQPLVLYPGMSKAMQHERLRASLDRCKLGNLVVHGARSIDADTGTYFVLAGMPHAFGARHTYLLHLIMPYLRTALERTLARERRQQSVEVPRRDAKELLSGREIHVLQWVQEGKSNREIAIILGISPLTVKNHLQHILKKLNAQNRAQAVARAISLKLVS